MLNYARAAGWLCAPRQSACETEAPAPLCPRLGNDHTFFIIACAVQQLGMARLEVVVFIACTAVLTSIVLVSRYVLETKSLLRISTS